MMRAKIYENADSRNHG
jgi:H+/Cl- antiporter ClcA